MKVNRRIAVLLLLLASGMAPPCLAADPAEQQYAAATRLYTQGQPARALDGFQKFLAEHGDHAKAPLARFYAGESLVQLHKYAQAVEQFRPLITLPDDPRLERKALFRAGESSYFAGNWTDSGKLLNQFLRRYTGDKLNAYVLPYLGDIAWEQGEFETSEKAYQRALAEFPEGPLADDCRYGLARIAEKKGQLDQARELYTAAAKARGGPAEMSRLHLAALEFAAGNFKRAATMYDELVRTSTDERAKNQARLGHAQSLVELKQPGEARILLQMLANVPELHVEASYWTGLAEIEQQNFRGAAGTLSAISVPTDHPLAPNIALELGEAWLQAGDAADACRAFDQVASNWPKSELADDALLGRARASLANHDSTAVQQSVEELQRKYPKSDLKLAATRVLVRSYLADHRYAEAIEVLEPLVKPAGRLSAATDADSSMDRYLLAFAYQGRKRSAEVLPLVAPLLTSSDAHLREDSIRLEATALIALEKFADAIEPLTGYLQTAADSEARAQAQAQLTVCYAREDKWPEARAAYEELQKLSAPAEILLPTTELLAEAALAADHQDWSAELFGYLAKQNGPPGLAAKGLAGLAWGELRAGGYAEAAEHFKQLIERYPDDPLAAGAGLARGQILEREKRYDEAYAAYQMVFERHRSTDSAPQALLGAARVEELAKHLESAAALYARLLKDYPKAGQRDQALYNTAWILGELGRHDEEEALFEQLHQGNWRSRYWSDALYRLAERALEKGDRAKSHALLVELIESQPDDQVLAHALYLQSQVAIAGEQWEQAEEPLVQLVEDYPDNPLANLARFWAAEVKYRAGKYTEAKDLFGRLATDFDGKHEKWMAMIPLRRAQICCHERQWADARRIAESIATDFPNFEQQYEVDYVLGRVLASDGRFDDAREAYSRVIRSQLGGKTETAAMAQWMIGESYFHQKNYDAAVREYLRLEVLYAFPTWQAGALLQAGKCYELLGDWTQATEIYARLLKNFPSTTFTDEAARRLRTSRHNLATKENDERQVMK